MKIQSAFPVTTTPQARFIRLASVLATAVVLPVHAADRWWDAGTVDIVANGDGVSGGGAGNWNTSTKNWDQGNGLAHVAWDNAAGDSAVFGSATAGTVTLASGITAGGISIVNSGSNYTISGSTITLTGAAPVITVAARAGTISSKLSGSLAGGLIKNGAAVLTFNGSVANDFTGGLKILGGTVNLNFANMATPTDLIGSGNAVSLGSGIFTVAAKSSGVTSQSVNGLVLNGGSSAGVIFTSSTSPSSALNLGSITRNANAVVNFTLPASGAITTTATNNANGILGTWASNGSGTSLKYTTVSGGAISTLTGTPAIDGSELIDTAGAANYDLAAGGGTVPASVSANTIRFTGAAGTTAPGSTLFAANGLMNAGTGLWTIGSNDVSIGATRELVIHTGANGITVSGVIKDNSAGASALTITGTGPLGLNTANSYSGTTTVHGTSAYGDSGSTLTIASPLKNAGTANPSEFGKGDTIVLHGAVIQITASNVTGTSDRNFSISGTSGFYLKNVMTQTLTGSISGSGNLSVDSDFVGSTSPGKGTLVLAGNNSFTGDVVFQNDGRITLANANALTNATLNLTGARVLADLSSNNLAYVIGGLKGSANLNLGSGLAGGGSGRVTIGGNHQSTSYTGVLSGTASLVKAGTGMLALGGANTYAGETVVDGGILAVNGSALPDSTRLIINSGRVAASGEELVDSLFFGGSMQASGTWGGSGSGAEHIDDTRFAGSAGVVRVRPWNVSPGVLDFSQVAVGSPVTGEVIITNLGTSTVSGAASTSGASFAVTESSWSVAPSSTTVLHVTFAPSASQTFSGVLTVVGEGLVRTVQLAGEGVPSSTPLPSQYRDYQCAGMVGMPVPASSGNLTVADGGTVTQGFIPRRDSFLAGYAARDAAAPSTCRLSQISIRTSSFTNSPTTIRFELLRVENDNSRTSLYTEDFQKTFFGNTTYSFLLTTPPAMSYDVSHELKITVVTAGTPSYGGPKNLTFFRPAADYTDGTSSATGDLWCDLQVRAPLPVFSGFSSAVGAGSRFFIDSDPLNADSSSYDTLPGKLLGTSSEAEPVVFTHPVAWGSLSFEIDSPGVATGSVTGTTGSTSTFTLAGQAEGKRMLWIRSGTTVVGWMKLQAYPRRALSLSYAYIQFPGESNHPLKSMGAEITAYISSVYDKANVGITWINHGVITHEWDLDGDGQSYEEDYGEVWSALDSGAIPNPLGVFSNVYMLRYDKDDSTIRGSGGGTSRGLADVPPPANGANVRCTLNRSAASLGSTLAHEVGHNLGLGHTDITNNLMDVGRAQDNLWAPQWAIIHNTLKTLPPPVINPDGNGNGILDSWENQMFGSSAAGANPATGDPDGDSLDNLLEYAFGTNPLQATVNPLAGDFETIGTDRYLRISVPKNPAATNLTFAAEVSENVSAWSGTGVVVEENSSNRFTARDGVPTSSSSARFIRLKVTVNP